MAKTIRKLQEQLKRINLEIEKERSETGSDDENTILNELLDKKSLIQRELTELNLQNTENSQKGKVCKYRLRLGNSIKTVIISTQQNPVSEQNDHISPLSPLALALDGKRVGDSVNVTTPVGTVDYEILDIN